MLLTPFHLFTQKGRQFKWFSTADAVLVRHSSHGSHLTSSTWHSRELMLATSAGARWACSLGVLTLLPAVATLCRLCAWIISNSYKYILNPHTLGSLSFIWLNVSNIQSQWPHPWILSICNSGWSCFNAERLRGSQESSLSVLHPPRSIYLSLTAIRLISLHLSLAQRACDGMSGCDGAWNQRKYWQGWISLPSGGVHMRKGWEQSREDMIR